MSDAAPAPTRRALLLGRPAGSAPAPIAAIGAGCLARHGVVCQSCGDACPERAIRFRPMLGRVALPAVATDRCTGCGECVALCPVAAITVPAGPEVGHVG
jgi:ferredoxin-type protein NapF